MNRIVLGIIGVVLLMIMFPMVLDATHTIQTDEQTNAALTLSGTPPAGAVTLTKDLWNDDADSVLSVVGDKPETLAVVGYTPATRTVSVTGVTTSTTATVVYEVDGLTEWMGMGALVGFTPLLVWIAILASLIGAIWSGVKSKIGEG